ncbi:MAG: hypothetical protein A2381_03145 [Bdellovibrionales bacterium RIFOXYB1_FULL_37_110]|nr:MAG: hypothetical protein A2181_00250 [Bdellovibrionales bacterium RIFOXYA1_FULL_38_20]OFZ48401.1 MAG: hypothetical protein A2417_03635 [Bdellovibrionales bacterium RIFOXYC1_FULL_37_79]OFZ57922.1 MAG: hypothetical protein A2381_03145 [Bdellovibrionales bacterium RIFOXYB1_FULL_37_110]OFZ60592.1 MAG: hypothetical protein A2328_10615 [Bdellovibrionales bacterium RIFOXYB2_FULL_36_6]OFZ63059.1 MAG: hypothetical protein A2577_15275 [Bdellovibrionales bacterium RIFOXYD1_FULL_36_51]
MKKIASIGSYLKKIHRGYGNNILSLLSQRGFTDLRISFLEVMLYVCEHNGPTIRDIGIGCNLKKQTMTSHLNELKKRGYLFTEINPKDRREQRVRLTEYGEKFKLNLIESVSELEKTYIDIIGEVELERVNLMLANFYEKLHESSLIS